MPLTGFLGTSLPSSGHFFCLPPLPPENVRSFSVTSSPRAAAVEQLQVKWCNIFLHQAKAIYIIEYCSNACFLYQCKFFIAQPESALCARIRACRTNPFCVPAADSSLPLQQMNRKKWRRCQKKMPCPGSRRICANTTSILNNTVPAWEVTSFTGIHFAFILLLLYNTPEKIRTHSTNE